MHSYNLGAGDILRSLYGGGNSEERLKGLTEIVLALLMEVEALREAMIKEAKSKSVVPKDSAYGQAYFHTGLLTHNSVGPSSGTDKLFLRWFPVRPNPDEINLREALMLVRLGFSPEEIGGYAAQADNLEILT